MLKDYLEEKDISLYYISKKTNISYSTINYIANNRISIKKTSLENAMKIANCLNVTIEELCDICESYTLQDFENFKSNVCHEVKDKGPIEFIKEIITSTRIEDKWKICRRQEALYLLAMVDYLCRLAELPQCTKYADYRRYKLEPVMYPLSYVMTETKFDLTPIPEFEMHGIMEGDIFNVC